MGDTHKDLVFLIPLPGGRVARVPIDVLEQYVDPSARLSHGGEPEEEDVTAHSMSVDPRTGASIWHTEWELGQCDYTDENGFPQSAYAWHRHPLGNEYTEIYQK
ncbi:hypothetical protein [Polyangium jinanense]|uniref:Uncharacterized protein n=1 Tax=Polyangium jinanense TaxID=2829994 RepID=A0A9X3X8T6_9BACT|nr:hypothetical protein [Polyangium jinanense]MDC3960763.1 hypothetical protein [Polyangium jinanense]MDC3985859.1 hypothetical protein [Polyangium jinanense]